MAIGGGRTFFDRQFLDDLMHVAKENGNIITIKGLNKALYYAMAPSSTEVGRYNIIPPPPLKSDGTLDSDVMKYEFIPYTDAATIQAAKSSPDGDPPAYRFYAPIAPKTAGDPKGLITKYLNDTLSGGLPDPRFGITMDDIRDQTKTGMFTYLSKLESGIGTEHGETESFAAVELPIYPPMLPNPPKYAVTSAAQVLSSFGSYVRMPGNTFSNPPRFGYSVRFVSMQDLQKEGLNDPDGEFDQVNH